MTASECCFGWSRGFILWWMFWLNWLEM